MDYTEKSQEAEPTLISRVHKAERLIEELSAEMRYLQRQMERVLGPEPRPEYPGKGS